MFLYGIALLAGIVTAISPCAYPVLPIVFAGGASGGRRRPYAIVAGLVATFIVPQLGHLLERPLARRTRRAPGDLGGGFVLGAALGLVFAPCAGVVLTGVVG